MSLYRIVSMHRVPTNLTLHIVNSPKHSPFCLEYCQGMRDELTRGGLLQATSGDVEQDVWDFVVNQQSNRAAIESATSHQSRVFWGLPES